ncbi:ZAR1-like protein [Lampris incognitus]|uniref:ZAR1-like protein n=1 Tax=Lampris incognitus TaxID=2546036 RepID=UPI0024B4A1BC|nr:ZAR1-like protein [Lampris incognitus]
MEGPLSTAPFRRDGSRGRRDRRPLTSQDLNYLDLCKAILSQVNSSGTPRPRGAPTRDCGVQVNAKVDKIVQCSLGPKTLFSCENDFPYAGKPKKIPFSPARVNKTPSTSPAKSGGRVQRPQSVCSPVCGRRTPEGTDLQPGCEEDERPESAVKEATTDVKKPILQPFKGNNFQFLEQRFGFFHCRMCNIRWESAYVWCIYGTKKVYHKQLCRKCQAGFNPYRVESVICKGCSQISCCCEKKQRHITMGRRHRQDLCCRCKGMKWSCDSTYRFRYVA